MSLEDMIAEANRNGILVNAIAQLNTPEGVTWSVSLFRRRSNKGFVYNYVNGLDPDLRKAFAQARAASDTACATLDASGIPEDEGQDPDDLLAKRMAKLSAKQMSLL